MVPLPNLKTARLKLRAFEPSDISRVAELCNDELVSRDLANVNYPYLLEDAERWVGGLPLEWEEGNSAVFAVCLRGTDDVSDLIGTVGIVFDPQSNRGELGYWIGRSYWGQGFATEACRSALDFAFGQLGLNKVVAECLTRNPASAAVLKKLGMVQEGYLAKHFRKHEADDYCDVRVFGLLRSIWNGN